MVFCSLIASSAIRAFISALKLRRCLDFISAPFPRQRFYTLLTGPNFGEHFSLVLLEKELSGLRDLKNSFTLAQLPAVFFAPSPLSVVPVAIQILVERRITYDAQKYLGETRCSSNAEFAVDGLQRHKNPARERASEGPGGGTSERERPIGKRTLNNDGCSRCV